MQLTRQTFLIGICCLFLPGCYAPGRTRLAPEVHKTHVIILPGILGPEYRNVHEILNGIESLANPDISYDVWDWTTDDVFGNLTDDVHNREEADRLAIHINALAKSNSETRFYIIGMSGGARIVYFLCDDSGISLETGFQFEKIILLSGAVSTLEPSQGVRQRSRLGIFNYCSSVDEVLPLASLGGIFFPIGLFGYMPDPPKVHELHWSLSMISHDNWGKHLQITREPLLHLCLLPLLSHDVDRWPAACRSWR